LPRFLDERVPWLPKQLSEAELRAVPLARSEARLALARDALAHMYGQDCTTMNMLASSAHPAHPVCRWPSPKRCWSSA